MDSSIGLSNLTAKSKDDFINKAHEARQARELVRHHERAATKIQAFLKSYHVRRKLKDGTLIKFENIMNAPNFNGKSELRTLTSLLFVCNQTKDRNTIDLLVKFIIKTTNSSLNPIEKNTDHNLLTNQHVVANNPKLLLEDAIRESIELSSDNMKLAHSLYQPISHKNFVLLIAENSKDNEKSVQQWFKFLSKLLNICSIFLLDSDSSRLDSQHIADYLYMINLFTSHKALARTIELSGIESSKYDLILDKFSGELFKTISHESNNFYPNITQLICDRIGRFRNDLKKTILKDYLAITMRLLKLDNEMPLPPPPHDFNKSNPSEVRFSSKILILMLSIPGFIYCLEKHSYDILNEIDTHSLARLSFNLSTECEEFQSLTSTQSVCLLANLIHLAALNEDVLSQSKVKFIALVTTILESCQKNIKSVTSHPRLHTTEGSKVASESMNVIFNPILGWLVREEALSIDKDIIKSQLSNLWSLKFLKIMFSDLIQINDKSENLENTKNSDNTAHSKRKNSLSPLKITLSNHPNESTPNQPVFGMFRRAVERATTVMTKNISQSSFSKLTGSSGNSGRAKLLTPESSRISLACLMLHTTLKTLTTLKQDILTGLCLHDFILTKLWKFISSLGPHNGLKAFLEHLSICTKTSSPEFHILILFCECASHLISILDDSELYEKQQPFQLEELVAIGSFLNNFVFSVITYNLVPITKKKEMDPILKATHKLLTDLYKRDCRRKFTPPDHWLIKDIKLSMTLKDLEARKPAAKAIMMMIPHIIPHKERVMIFRRLVSRDKTQYCAGPSTLITIHRSRIVEDGYQQLIRLPPHALKGLIRVKFINDFGLDEAGIDQDGVFKEFLEDTIKRVFDPALNLFSTTSEQCLYPSPTSRMHEDYLSLFNFVGKMLGKAVYEGIVVDVPFASFFLSRVLGQPQSPLYSPIDELPSLDPELYKSLTYIKHYEGDVSELDLTFSIDQDFMGKIETYELEPGGKSIPVTRESRVRYIHSVANFRMKTQIEKQTEAFVGGFRSIINSEWLSMFSSSEFQRLISGDNKPIDLQDLRRHTKYFGGFHNNHRVVSWLWDILEKDFTPEEHRLFLKFVTSCSKPPLLGFSNLEPPFSIRCVEVSDDQDLGDTVGSVLRSFFDIRRSDPVDRLPTSSTCFNLLKLPNYQRRSTLREKLRYAISSNPGFELS